MPIGDRGEQRQQHEVDEGFHRYCAASTWRSSFAAACRAGVEPSWRSSESSGLMPSCSAARARAWVATGLVKKKQDRKTSFSGDQRQAGLQHEADEQEAGAERIGDTGRVHAGDRDRACA